MFTRQHFWPRFWALALVFALAVVCLPVVWLPVACADDPPANFEVHEISVFVVEPGGEFANARSAYPSALPVTVNSTRTAASSPEARRTAPVSLITFHGQPTANLDVDLRTSAGTLLAHWPPGDAVPNRLRWFGTPQLDLVEAIEEQSELVYVEADDWVVKARAGDALYVKRGARSEKFLAYDVELKLAAPIRLEGGPDKYTAYNLSDRPLYDVVIARATPEGVRVAWIDELPPSSKPSKPAAAPQPAQAPGKPDPQPAARANVADLFDDAKPAAAEDAAAPKPKQPSPKGLPKGAVPKAKAPAEIAAENEKAKAEQARAKAIEERAAAMARAVARAVGKDPPPAAQPGGLFGGLPKPQPGTGVDVSLCEPLAAADAPAKTTQALSERLAKTGLSAHEIDSFTSHYGPLFFEDDSLVVGCRLSPSLVDEKIPLSIFPVPAKTVRVAMLVVHNVDPQLGGEIDGLIAQLGDAKFSVREAAQQRLRELGPLAFAALQKGAGNTDPEIAIRCERILLSQNQTPGSAAARPAAGGAVLRNGVFVAPAR